MKPVKFNGVNLTYKKPDNMTDKECGSLPVNQKDGVIVSCWELSEEDIENLIRTKIIWLGVHTNVQPPVYLTVHMPIQVLNKK